MPPFSDSPHGAVLTVRVTPRAGRTLVSGVSPDGTLLVRVAAAPVDGAANQAVIDEVADLLAVPRRIIRIRSGERSRTKRLEFAGHAAAELNGRLDAALASR